MLGSIIASKTAKLMAACVCPVIGAGALTMSVPKVRSAVHKATAPREYALPKERERMATPIATIAPCTTTAATPLSAGYSEDVPTSLYPFPGGSTPVAGTPLVPLSYGGPTVKTPIPTAPPGGGAVPEPHTWLQLLVGFILVGGAIRVARNDLTEEEAEMLDRVEKLRN